MRISRTLTGVIGAMLVALPLQLRAQESCGTIVLFASGQTAPGGAAVEALQTFAAANQDSGFAVTGYTDASGSADANRALSQRRADAVAGILQQAGLAIVSVVGSGEAVRPGTSGPEDPANRRVEIVNTECEGGLFAGPPPSGGGEIPATGFAVAGGVTLLGLAAALGGDDDDDGGSGTGTTGTAD